jgi:hypothetical protein
MGIREASHIRIVKNNSRTAGTNAPVLPPTIASSISFSAAGVLPFVVDSNQVTNLSSKSPIEGLQPYAEYWEWQEFFDEYKDEIYFLKNIADGHREIKTPQDIAKAEKLAGAGFLDITVEKRLLRSIKHYAVTDRGQRIMRWQDEGLPLPLRHEIPSEFLHRYGFSGPNEYAEVTAAGRRMVSYFRHQRGYEIDDNYLSFVDLNFDEAHPEYFGMRMTSSSTDERAAQERTERALEMVSDSGSFLRSYPVFLEGKNGTVAFAVPASSGKDGYTFVLDATLWNYYRQKYGKGIHVLIPEASVKEQQHRDEMAHEARERIRKTGNISAGAVYGMMMTSDHLVLPLMVMRNNETVGIINTGVLRSGDYAKEISELYR